MNDKTCGRCTYIVNHTVTPKRRTCKRCGKRQWKEGSSWLNSDPNGPAMPAVMIPVPPIEPKKPVLKRTDFTDKNNEPAPKSSLYAPGESRQCCSNPACKSTKREKLQSKVRPYPKRRCRYWKCGDCGRRNSSVEMLESTESETRHDF